MKKECIKRHYYSINFHNILITISDCIQNEIKISTEPKPLTTEEKLEDFEYMYFINKRKLSLPKSK